MRSSTLKSLAATAAVVFTLTLTPAAGASPQRPAPRARTTVSASSDLPQRFFAAVQRLLNFIATKAEPAIPLPGPTSNAEPAIPLPDRAD